MTETGAHPILRSKSFWPVALASAAGIAALSYAFWTQTSAGRLAAEREVDVEIAAAEKVIVPGVAEAVGRLEAAKQTNILSPLQGVLKEVRAKVGDRVQSGDVVAVVQAKELLERADANETARQAALASLHQLKTRLEKAEEKLATTRDLYHKDLIARREVEEMETAAEMARAEEERAQAELAQREAALAQARYLLGQSRIQAPASGIVTRRLIEPGAALPFSAVIMSIADPAMMRVTIPVRAVEAGFIHTGMAAQVRSVALPEKTHSGTVTKVKMAMEGEGATAQIDVANPDGLLKPGLEASVSVALGETRELIVVPHAAVFELDGQPSVYLVEGRRARARNVARAGEISDKTVITSNLAEGEKVIVAAGAKLQSGSYVRIVERSETKRQSLLPLSPKL